MDKRDLNKKCENCRYFRPDVVNMHQGKCHINPPAVFPVMQPNHTLGFTSGHPPTLRDSWCGEHEETTMLH